MSLIEAMQADLQDGLPLREPGPEARALANELRRELLAAEGADAAVLQDLDWWSRVYETFVAGERLDWLCQPVLDDLSAKGLSDPDKARRMARMAMWCHLGEPKKVEVTRLEWPWVSDLLRRYRRLPVANVVGTVESYYRALGLLDPYGLLTEAGAVFIELGRDAAVRWLLHLEVMASVHGDSRDLLSASRARALERGDHDRILGESIDWTFPSVLTGRLEALGVFAVDEIDESTCLSPFGQRLLTEEFGGEPSMLGRLVQSLRADEVLKPVRERTPELGSAVTRHLEFAEELTHQLQNALIPLRMVMASLEGQQEPGMEPAVLRRMRAAMERLDSIAADANDSSRLLIQRARVFGVESCVLEALAATRAERNGRVRVETHLVDAQVSGAQDRLITALVELIRNVAQLETSRPVLLEVHVQVSGDKVEIVVQDDGPGVAASSRDQIFAKGFSTRVDGSGRGLAIAKRAVERDLGGRLTLVPTSVGARFVIALPLVRIHP